MSKCWADNGSRIMMVGTAPGNGGGIAAVVRGYLETGIAGRLGIDYFPTHRSGSVFGKLLFYLRGLVVIAWKIGCYRIVHVHTASFWSFRRLFFVMMLTRLRRKKLVIHLHGGQFDDYYRRAFFLEQWCIRLAFSGADRVVLLAEHLREKVNGVCQPERCLIIPNGVVVPELADTSLGQQSPQRMILFLGDIVRRKGVYDLVDAVACINTQIPFNVVLAGAGETQEVVGYAAAKQGAAHFTFPGWVSGAVKEALVRNALAFVLPSYAESMPMSILEAMSYGVPVVATTVGGIPEIIRHGIEGILVAPGDVEGLARALQELLEDEAKRLAMSRACRERVQELFSAERVENALCCLYGELAVGSH